MFASNDAVQQSLTRGVLVLSAIMVVGPELACSSRYLYTAAQDN
ncbi:MAG: hypothetical protein P8J68_02090 [Arenicellaceae bacterium]|nr:hypothetical protein [Arenicellaceae bacterium]